MTLEQKIKRLQGPILVLGASGFVGANLLRQLLNYRDDVFGTTSRFPAWRLEGLNDENIVAVDLLVDSNLDFLLEKPSRKQYLIAWLLVLILLKKIVNLSIKLI